LRLGIPRLSRSLCVSFGNFLGDVAFLCDRRGKRIGLENLECAFGAKYSRLDRLAIIRQSYRTFTRTMLDLFWFQRLDAGNFRRWVHLTGFEEIREESRRRQCGVAFMCVHQGNWEWANLGAGFSGFRNVTVVENFKNPLLTRIFARLREHSGATIVTQEAAILKMNRALKAGASTGMLIDLTTRPGRLATAVEAFKPGGRDDGEGIKICAPIIHALLTQRTGALLVPVETEPHEDGTVSVTAHPPVCVDGDATLAEIAQRCWNAFEPILRDRPGEYLWVYKHFRYRPKSTARPYPGYSNTSSSFEKMLLNESAVRESAAH